MAPHLCLSAVSLTRYSLVKQSYRSFILESGLETPSRTNKYATISYGTLAARAYHTTPALSGLSWLDKLRDHYGIRGQQRRILVAEHLFRSAQRQSNDRRWHTDFKVDVSFRPVQSLLTLHVWMVNRRLVIEAKAALETSPVLNWELVQQEFLETFWHDTKVRIRAEGVRELSVDKGLRDVQNYSLQQCMALDHVVDQITNDKKARLDNLGLVIWTNVYYGCHDGKDDDGAVPDEYIDAIAKYTLQQYDNISSKLPQAYFAEGRVSWITPPSSTNLPEWTDSFVTDSLIEAKLGPVLPKNWFTALTEAGDRYYWNEVTKETAWDIPTVHSQGNKNN